MTDQWGTPGGDRDDDEPELRDLFAAYRSGYRPDEAAIWDRFSELRDGPGHRPARAGGWGRGLAMGAAAVAAAAAAVVYLQPPPEEVRTADPGPAASATASPPPVEGSLATLPAPSGDLPGSGDDPAPPGSTPDGGDTTGTVPGDTSTSTTGAGGDATGQAGSAGMSVEALPSTLELSAVGHLDWVVAGARSDGTLITLDDGDPAIAIQPTGVPTPTAAPIDITWTDGRPEEDRTVNGQWSTVPATAAFEITVIVPATADQVSIYGGGDGEVVVTATVDGVDTGQEVPLPASPTGTGGVVRVDVTGARNRVLTVTISGSGDAGPVSLGAVTIR